MTIGWYSVSKTEMPLREYENLREPERVSHRLLLRQHPSERYVLLQNLGFSRLELQRAEASANEIRESREQSLLDDVGSDDTKLRRRLTILYEHAQQLKQQQLQRQHALQLSKPVLSKILRRFVGGGATNQSNKITTIRSDLSVKRKSYTVAAR